MTAPSIAVLVVEDDPILSLLWTDAFTLADIQVLGPCPSNRDALAVLEDQHVDAALLDIDVLDGPSFPVARELQDKAIAYVFCSGRAEPNIPDDLRPHAVLQKPMRMSRIVRVVREMAGVFPSGPLLPQGGEEPV